MAHPDPAPPPLIPQQLLLQPEDLQRLGDAIGGALAAAPAAAPPAPPTGLRKVPLFTESSDPVEWKTWRARFATVARIANWPDERGRRELFAAMGGSAARIVADINPEAPGLTLAQMLEAYEARFVTRTASDQARAEFGQAVQLTSETVLEWHSRLRDLFLRAYPGAGVDIDPGGQLLRDQYAKGLDNPAIREFVFDRRPATYAASLEAAQSKQATVLLMATTKKSATPSVNAMASNTSSPTLSSDSCFFCEKAGHFLRQCPLLDKARTLLSDQQKKPDAPKGGRGRGKNNRGRGRGRGRGGTRTGTDKKAGLYALEGDEGASEGDQQEEEDAEPEKEEN